MCEWNTNTTVTICRPNEISGRTAVEVDSCIAPIVQALNDAGIATEGCCCGHEKGPGSILLADGRELIILTRKEKTMSEKEEVSVPKYTPEVGDRVKHERPRELCCGSGWYRHAYVVQANPLVLVSPEGDMLWGKIDPDRLVFDGKADWAEIYAPMGRFLYGEKKYEALRTQAAEQQREIERLRKECNREIDAKHDAIIEIERLTKLLECERNEVKGVRGDYEKMKANRDELKWRIVELKAQLAARQSADAEAIERAVGELSDEFAKDSYACCANGHYSSSGYYRKRIMELVKGFVAIITPGTAERPVVGQKYEGGPKHDAEWVACKANYGRWLMLKVVNGKPYYTHGMHEGGERTGGFSDIEKHVYISEPLAPPAVPEEGLAWDDYENGWAAVMGTPKYFVQAQCGYEERYVAWFEEPGRPVSFGGLYVGLDHTAAKAACEAHHRESKG